MNAVKEKIRGRLAAGLTLTKKQADKYRRLMLTRKLVIEAREGKTRKAQALALDAVPEPMKVTEPQPPTEQELKAAFEAKIQAAGVKMVAGKWRTQKGHFASKKLLAELGLDDAAENSSVPVEESPDGDEDSDIPVKKIEAMAPDWDTREQE